MKYYIEPGTKIYPLISLGRARANVHLLLSEHVQVVGERVRYGFPKYSRQYRGGAKKVVRRWKFLEYKEAHVILPTDKHMGLFYYSVFVYFHDTHDDYAGFLVDKDYIMHD